MFFGIGIHQYKNLGVVAIGNELVALDFDRDFVGTQIWGECYVAAEPAANCDPYIESSYSVASVVTIATPSLSDYPEAYDYSKAREVSMAALGAADSLVSEGSTSEDAAKWYLSNYEDEWTAWVSEDVADAVRAAL